MSVFQTDVPLHLFHHGENFETYRLMGAHPAIYKRRRGFIFRVWAPRAKRVSIIGEFNNWNEDSHVMEKMIDGETFELFIPNLKVFDVYKYCIHAQAVDVEVFQKENCTGNQERNDFISAVIETACSPPFIFHSIPL